MRHFIWVAVISLASSIRAVAQPDPSPKLELRCPSPCTFRQGESIWLDLDFTASTPSNYTVLTNYVNRNMAREQFTVTPQDGASDPLGPYMRLLQVQGGSFNFIRKPLSESPVTVPINLSQWVRFDTPGTYHVRVISTRVSPSVRLPSNDVEIRIVQADSQWQQEQLQRILPAIDASPPRFLGDSPSEVQELCDLGTEAAAIEIARRIGGDRRAFYLYEFGLIRSPYRAAGIAELERLLVDPDAPVSLYFFTGLANISLDPVSDPAQLIRQAQAKRAEVRQKLIEALPLKRGQAKTTSEETLRR